MIVKQMAKSPMLGLVDCGIHEEGVDELEEELRTAWRTLLDSGAPLPAVHFHRDKSYLFLHTSDVALVRMAWREI